MRSHEKPREAMRRDEKPREATRSHEKPRRPADRLPRALPEYRPAFRLIATRSPPLFHPQRRLKDGKIYTWAGDVLLALNPYHRIPEVGVPDGFTARIE